MTLYLIPEPVEGPTDVYDCKFTQYKIGLWCNIYNAHNIPVEGTGNTIGKKTPVKKQTLDSKIRNAKDCLRNKSVVGQNSGN